MKPILKLFTAGLILSALQFGCDKTPASKCENYITARGDKLFNGNEEFRFISYNTSDLHYVEDIMDFEQAIPFRFPDEFER